MRHSWNTEIVAVGTELLLGQIANTNAEWISEKLASIGLNVFYHSVVGDNLNRVCDVFQTASKRADIIIVTGGLGPTEDDLTKEAFQSLSHLEMIEHQPSMAKITKHYNRKKQIMTPNNRKQANVFKDATIFNNIVGMAPGMMVTYNKKIWIFMPGVPREMKALMKDILPHLQKITGNQMIIKSEMLQFRGIGESRLEHKLKVLIQGQTNPTIAPLVQKNGVALRLTAKAMTQDLAQDHIEKVKQQILQIVGDYYVVSEDQVAVTDIFTLLKSQQKTIAAAESLTGGMFCDKLIRQKGASAIIKGGIVCYDTSVKENVLQIPKNIIQDKGTVSKECALLMAEQVQNLLHATIGISFTGVAGPDKLENQPPGTVFIAISGESGKQIVKKYVFKGDRDAIRNQTVQKGNELLYQYLK